MINSQQGSPIIITFINQFIVKQSREQAQKMLQKKRNQLQKIIRRSHMQKTFQQKRNQLLKIYEFEEPGTLQYFFQLTNIFIKVRSSIKKNTDQYKDLLLTLLSYSCKNSMPNTKYLNQKQNCQLVCSLMSKAIQNLGYQDSDDQKNDQEIPQLEINAQVFIVYHILAFVKGTQFIFLSNQIITKLLDSVWLLLSSNILFYQMEDYQILRQFLNFIDTIFKLDSNQLFSALQNKGIGAGLIRIIKYISNLKISLDIHTLICKVIDSYVSFKKSITKNSQGKIIQAYIVTSSSRQKQQLMAYCLNIIVKKQYSLYRYCLSAIKNILSLHQYLTQHIKIQHLKIAVEMVLYKDRQIQNQALSFVQEIIYFSKDCTDQLLKDNWILNIIQNRLRIQAFTKDNFVTENVQKCAYIICNLTLTQNRKQLDAIFKHSIWTLVYQNMNLSSKLFPLIMTMEYFFQRIDRKRAMLFLDSYFQALRQIDLKMCGEYLKFIKNTIMVLYRKMQFWSEECCQKFRDVIARNNLKDYLQVQMDLQF